MPLSIDFCALPDAEKCDVQLYVDALRDALCVVQDELDCQYDEIKCVPCDTPPPFDYLWTDPPLNCGSVPCGNIVVELPGPTCPDPTLWTTDGTGNWNSVAFSLNVETGTQAAGPLSGFDPPNFYRPAINNLLVTQVVNDIVLLDFDIDGDHLGLPQVPNRDYLIRYQIRENGVPIYTFDSAPSYEQGSGYYKFDDVTYLHTATAAGVAQYTLWFQAVLMAGPALVFYNFRVHYAYGRAVNLGQ